MKTPTTTQASPLCEGFVIELGGTSGKGKKDLATARKVTTSVLGSGWSVARLAPKCPEYEVLRKDGKAVSISNSWDLLRALRDHSQVRSADQAMIIPGSDPAPIQVLPKNKSLQAKGKKKKKPLACSSNAEWSLTKTFVPEAWQLSPPTGGKKFGSGIVVGHPDTGYTKHPEIFASGQILASKGYDFEDDKANPVDPLKKGFTSHGTSTASVIMSPKGKQVSSGTAWVTGVAPSAKLVPIRVSTSVIHISFRNVAKAIRHAADKNCHVISMSLGGPIGYGYLRRAVDYAIGKGVIVFAAVGNQWPFVVYPARFPQVIGVAACNCQYKKWSGSASGKTVDMAAPGESVWRAKSEKSAPKFRVTQGSGTSFAVATTAGACALWLAFHGRQKLINKYGAARLADVFQNHLKRNGVHRPTGWDTKKMGTGVLHVEKLLETTVTAVAPKALKPKSASALTEIAEYIPGADRKKLAATLAAVFGVKGKALTATTEEIIFHLVTNPELRASIEKAVRPVLKGKGAKKAKAPAKPNLKKILKDNPRLNRFASKSLKVHLQSK